MSQRWSWLKADCAGLASRWGTNPSHTISRCKAMAKSTTMQPPTLSSRCQLCPRWDAHHEEAVSTSVVELSAAETPGVIELVPVAETAVSIPIQEAHEDTAVSNTNPIWHLLVYIAIGLIIGGSIYAWPKAARRAARNKQFQSPIPNPSTRSGQVPQSLPEESNHA